MAKTSKAQRIRNYLSEHPDASVEEIRHFTKASPSQIYGVRGENKRLAAKKAAQGTPNKWVMSHISTCDDSVEDETGNVGVDLSEMIKALNKHDPVNQPAHYKTGGIETIDFIEAKELNYHLGNVVKYIARAEHKGDRMENLLKAQWYLDREIQNAHIADMGATE